LFRVTRLTEQIHMKATISSGNPTLKVARWWYPQVLRSVWHPWPEIPEVASPNASKKTDLLIYFILTLWQFLE
jgi:hypothetical protein